MKFLKFLFVIYIFSSIPGLAQVRDYELGKSMLDMRYNQQTGFFDLSDPESVNIKVSVWGYVRYPGKYLVPIYTTAADLLSFAGGPNTDAELDDLRLFKTAEDSTQYMVKFSLDDLMWQSKLTTNNRKIPKLDAGDILVVAGAPRYFFRDYLGMTLSIVSALISIATLIIVITK